MDYSSAIDLHRVSKVYGRKVRALTDLTLQVKVGEIFGLLGPNGAGKSTLVKILMTVIRPTEAHGSVLGQPVGHKPTLRRVGYLPENHRFPRYLTGRQVLEFFGGLAGLTRRDSKSRCDELLSRVGMMAWANKRVGQYSKGMMQRIGLAQAMVHNPRLILLDEPTDGVDPVGRREIRDVLIELKKQGVTVFINSHLLSELELVCDRVAILVGGKLYSQGTLSELTQGREFYELELQTPGAPDGMVVSAGVESGLLNWVMSHTQVPWEMQDGVMKLQTTHAGSLQAVLDAARSKGLVVSKLVQRRPNLEDMFMEAVQQQSPDSTAAGARI